MLYAPCSMLLAFYSTMIKETLVKDLEFTSYSAPRRYFRTRTGLPSRKAMISSMASRYMRERFSTDT